MLETQSRQNAFFAIFLLVFASSFAVTIALFLAPGIIGQIAFLLCKIALLALPISWFFWIDGDRLKISPPRWNEVFVGIGLGLLMFAAICGAYWLFGDGIDPGVARERAQQAGITNPTRYWIGAAYFCFVNALVEEYIWRWFVYRKCEILLPGIRAVWLSALLFTLHHILALSAYTAWPIVILGSLGVFLAGAIWSWCYLTYRSIVSGYISHILADLAIAIVGWQILFS